MRTYFTSNNRHSYVKKLTTEFHRVPKGVSQRLKALKITDNWSHITYIWSRITYIWTPITYIWSHITYIWTLITYNSSPLRLFSPLTRPAFCVQIRVLNVHSLFQFCHPFRVFYLWLFIFCYNHGTLSWFVNSWCWTRCFYPGFALHTNFQIVTLAH